MIAFACVHAALGVAFGTALGAAVWLMSGDSTYYPNCVLFFTLLGFLAGLLAYAGPATDQESA